MRPRSTSRPATPFAGTAPVPVHEPLGEAPAALGALLDTLELAFARGVEHVHLEPAETGWRLRLRHDDGLEETLLDASHALPDALARLTRHGRAFTVRLGSERRLLELTTRSSTRGPSHLLTLHGSALAPPRLDALGLGAPRLRTLRALLGGERDAARGDGPDPRRGGRGGWLAIGSGSDVDGATLVRAIAQELAAPERALLCLESGPHPPLPRTVQIDIEGGLPEPLAPDTDAVLLAATPPGDVLAALADRAARGLLVVAHAIARRPSEALAPPLAVGVEPAWLALNLPAVVMRYRLRLLCPACRVRDRGRDAEAPLGTSPETGLIDVAAWLESTFATRYRRGEGCPHCGGSALAGVRDLTDIVAPDEAVRAALLGGRLEEALALLDASSDIAPRLSALVASGDIDAEEAMRHLVPRR